MKIDYFFGISTASKKCSQLNDKLQEERNGIFFELCIINKTFPELFLVIPHYSKAA